ncbi:MAG TPA: 30S ribosomal protein S15 [Flavobacteriales bacterium]|nr:30S ribosomal protein S15 [Flavobacteriales bacterium]HIN38938.1 30S ribosomal protein S15 [Flavobacteriales bacterium]
MSLTAETKKEVFKKHNSKEADTGTAEGQIALFTAKIAEITEHLKANKKDLASQRALVLIVGRRRRLLKYLHSKDIERYRAIIKKLNLRK